LQLNSNNKIRIAIFREIRPDVRITQEMKGIVEGFGWFWRVDIRTVVLVATRSQRCETIRR